GYDSRAANARTRIFCKERFSKNIDQTRKNLENLRDLRAGHAGPVYQSQPSFINRSDVRLGPFCQIDCNPWEARSRMALSTRAHQMWFWSLSRYEPRSE